MLGILIVDIFELIDCDPIVFGKLEGACWAEGGLRGLHTLEYRVQDGWRVLRALVQNIREVVLDQGVHLRECLEGPSIGFGKIPDCPVVLEGVLEPKATHSVVPLLRSRHCEILRVVSAKIPGRAKPGV